MKEERPWRIDSKCNDIYCDMCGLKVEGTDGKDYYSYKAGPPFYDTIYICKECHDRNSEVKNGRE